MSLILDALNRSRQDANPVPGLATHHPVEHIGVDRRRYLPWIALAVAIVLIAWLVVDRIIAKPAPPAEIGAPVAELSRNIGDAVTSVTTELKARAAVAEQGAQPLPAQSPTVNAATPNAGNPAVLAATAPEPDSASQPVAALQSVSASVVEDAAQAVPALASGAQSAAQPVPQPISQQEAAAAAEPAVTAAHPGAGDDAAVARLYQNRDVEEEPRASKPDAKPKASKSAAARTEKSVDVEKILTQAREEMEDASLTDHPAPFLSNLSQQIKDSIPTLYYHRHEYSNNPAQSLVVLNDKTVKVGGSPVPGMTVDEILPDSVVLTYRGTQFRLRALNSWINL